MSEIFFSADDYGLTKGLSDTLYKKILTYSSLRRVSAVPNGYDFTKESIDKIKRIVDLKITCHLNIVEGKPLSASRTVSLLIDDTGHMDNSFAKIIRVILFATKGKKRRYFMQIYREVYTQIKCFTKNIPDRDIEINSHSHIHLMLPFLRMISRISGKIKISSIRLPREVFYLDFRSSGPVRNFLSPNLIKYFLTKIMVHFGKNFLRTSNLKNSFSENAYFIGVYYTKNMSIEVVKGCIKKIVQKDQHWESVEILLHPGKLSKGDIERHILNSGTKKYYLTKIHQDEEAILKNSEIIFGMGA